MRGKIGLFLVASTLGGRPMGIGQTLGGNNQPRSFERCRQILRRRGSNLFTASSWGVTTLVLADLVAWGTYPYTWFTWWLGDFAGILVITPSLLVLSGGAYAKQRSRKMTFPLLGFGSGLTLIAFFVLWQIERQAVEAGLNTAHSVWPWGFLLAGLAFTALLAIYIEAHRREAKLLAAHSDLETRVQVRTRELAQVNRELRTEIAERERAEAQRVPMVNGLTSAPLTRTA